MVFWFLFCLSIKKEVKIGCFFFFKEGFGIFVVYVLLARKDLLMTVEAIFTNMLHCAFVFLPQKPLLFVVSVL